MVYGSYRENISKKSLDLPSFANDNYKKASENNKKKMSKTSKHNNKKFKSNSSTSRLIRSIVISAGLIGLAFAANHVISKNDSEMAKFNSYMEHSVNDDPVFLINDYSRVKSSNYMISKMLENATQKDLEAYQQLIVVLPEFIKGLDEKPENRDLAKYNKSIETILNNKNFILSMLDDDLSAKLKMAITNENKDKLGLKDVTNLKDINFKYNTYVNDKDGIREDRIIATGLSKDPIATLNNTDSYAIKQIAELRGNILYKEQNLKHEPNSYSDEQKAKDLYTLLMMNKYLDESKLEVKGNKINTKHHDELTVDYKHLGAEQKQTLIKNFSERVSNSIEEVKDSKIKEQKKVELESIDTKDELEEKIEKTRLDDDIFER